MEVIERTPWPAKSILDYSKISDGAWGYLIIFQDLTFKFDTEEVPSETEIMSRWAYRFSSK